MSYYLTFDWTIHSGDAEREEDRTITVHFDATPYIPARISGPPEHCHPAEGGEIEILGVVDAETGEDLMAAVNLDRLEQHIRDEPADDDVDPPEPEYYDNPRY